MGNKAKEPRRWLAVDQYGSHLYLIGNFPRKALLTRTGCRSARKVYRDKLDGRTIHVGYIVGGQWFDLFELLPFERAA
jgi:hypothetical protein